MRLEFIEAGEIVNVHGLRGEVKVLCWLDDPEMLCEFDRCIIDGKEMVMEQVRVQKTCNLVKLSGIDTMEAAQAMRGKIIELYREDIDDEVIFAAELIGMEVYAGGECIGKIKEKYFLYTIFDSVKVSCAKILPHIGGNGIAVGQGGDFQQAVELVGGGIAGDEGHAEAVDDGL